MVGSSSLVALVSVLVTVLLVTVLMTVLVTVLVTMLVAVLVALPRTTRHKLLNESGGLAGDVTVEHRHTDVQREATETGAVEAAK